MSKSTDDKYSWFICQYGWRAWFMLMFTAVLEVFAGIFALLTLSQIQNPFEAGVMQGMRWHTQAACKYMRARPDRFPVEPK